MLFIVCFVIHLRKRRGTVILLDYAICEVVNTLRFGKDDTKIILYNYIVR